MLCAGEFSVKRVRVLVANHPRLMRELVLATIADQPDIEVVGEVQNESELAEIVEQVLPDVLIIAMDEPEKRLGQCGFLLGRHPEMRILALGAGAEPGNLLLGGGRHSNQSAGELRSGHSECGAGASDFGGGWRRIEEAISGEFGNSPRQRTAPRFAVGF